MNFKLLAFLVCAVYGIWYSTVGGKQIDEKHVAALYRDYTGAFDRGDGKAVCDLFSDKVHGSFTNPTRSKLVSETISKASACASVESFYLAKQRLEMASGQDLHTNINFTMKSLSIAPDKKSANAEVLIEWRIGSTAGALLDMRSTQTDVIQRDFGKAQFVQSDGQVKFYR